jgi:two-component system, NtrC family, response regulator AtoC
VAFSLYVFAPGGVRVHTLGDAGTVTLGRSDECDICIDDRSVSRVHAKLHWTSDTREIEDLGGSNGTRIRRSQAASETHQVVEQRIALGTRVALQLDEPILLGSVTVVLRLAESQPVAPNAGPTSAPAEAAGDVVAISPQTIATFDLAKRVARGHLNVIVTGETGVGKEILALYLHQHSTRSAHAFVEVNCASIAESLAESELFGHSKGAFTGAVSAKEGFFEAAHNGTLFLDEVGELSAAIQAKLLRVLESGKVTRVGSAQATPVNVRVVAATHRDLQADIASGRFRQDLFFRLNGMTVQVPPLRGRALDIPELAARFASRTAKLMGLPPPRFSEAALAKLASYRYPGNIRELRNIVDRACALAYTGPIDVEHIVFDDPTWQQAQASSVLPQAVLPPAVSEEGADLRGDMAAEEKRRILSALESCGGNQTKAADKLGMPRRTLVARLSEYGLTKPRSK